MATGITIIGKTAYITPTGFKLTAKGKVTPPADFYRTLPKGVRRRLRKFAYSNGFVRHAAAR